MCFVMVDDPTRIIPPSEREYSLVIIKPDATALGLDVTIFGQIECEMRMNKLAVNNLISVIIDRLSDEALAAHYHHILQKTYYGDVKAYMQSGPVWAAVLEGPQGIVQKIREIVGDTDPLKAKPGTIRARYGRVLQDGQIQNSVHASATPKEALVEIGRFFTREQIQRVRPELAEKIWGKDKAES